MDKKKSSGKPAGLTRGTKKLIARAIEETGSLNSSVLCNHICEDLCSKFAGDSLDYQLDRMNIPTTQAVIDAIDTYIFRHSKNNEVSIISKGKDSEAE